MGAWERGGTPTVVIPDVTLFYVAIRNLEKNNPWKG